MNKWEMTNGNLPYKQQAFELFSQKTGSPRNFLNSDKLPEMELKSDSEVHPLKISRNERAGRETSS